MLKTEYGNFVDDPIKRLTADEVYQDYLKNKDKQIDICPTKEKTLEELTKENEQLWQTVEFLLKKTGMIGDEKNEILSW